MARETIRTLLVIAGDSAQRRLVSAIAARAGWRSTIVDKVDAMWSALVLPGSGKKIWR